MLKIYFIPGYLGNPADYAPLIHALRDQFLQKGFSKDILDFISLSTPFTLSKEDTLRFFHQKIKNADIVIGYSMGGRILLELKKQNRNLAKKYIILSANPSAVNKKERQKWDQKWIKYALENGVESFLQKWYDQPLFQGIKKEKLLPLRKELTLDEVIMPLKNLSIATQSCLWEELKQENTFYLCGEKDKKYSNFKELANAKSFMVKNAHHAIHLEKPKVCAEQIYAFIKDYCHAIYTRTGN